MQNRECRSSGGRQERSPPLKDSDAKRVEIQLQPGEHRSRSTFRTTVHLLEKRPVVVRPIARDPFVVAHQRKTSLPRPGAIGRTQAALTEHPCDRKSTRLNSSHANISYA